MVDLRGQILKEPQAWLVVPVSFLYLRLCEPQLHALHQGGLSRPSPIPMP